MKNESWAEKEEVIKTNKPLKLMLILLKILPGWIVRALLYPISFFYFLFSKEAVRAGKNYQQKLKDYTNGECPKKISGYKHILSFALCLVEKFEGWLGKIPFERIQYQDDDIKDILDNLKKGQGALLVTSHLGNMELLRSLSEYNTTLVSREVPVYVVKEVGASEQFNKTLQEINPDFCLNIIDASNIGPDTICQMMDVVNDGGLIVIAGDRTAAHNSKDVLKEKFLGEEALFPYGTFLIPFLMKTPVYYMFGLRNKFSIFNPKYEVYIEKSHINFECKRSEREEMIKETCREFISKIERFCKKYPYQWYNFFNFWEIK